MQTDLRLETKFMSQETYLPEIFAWLKSSPFIFKKLYPERRVNSIYFDTPAMDTFQSNLDGVSRRQKLRFRWYGTSAFPIDGTLEVKNRQNNYGWKNLYPVKGLKTSEDMSWTSFKKQLSTRLSKEGDSFLKMYHDPTLIVSYSRAYYQDHHAKLRITIDRDIHFYEQFSINKPNFKKNKPCHSLIVVEAKFSKRDQFYANQALRSIPIRNSRCSKYILGNL